MDLKDRMLMLIEAQARRRLGELAGELARSASGEREDILAGIEFERWLADSCREALWKP